MSKRDWRVCRMVGGPAAGRSLEGPAGREPAFVSLEDGAWMYRKEVLANGAVRYVYDLSSPGERAAVAQATAEVAARSLAGRPLNGSDMA